MRILLDTNAWVWFVSGSPNLGSKAKKFIESEKHELYLSAITIWEVMLLGERKRLTLLPSVEQWIDDALDALQIVDVPVSRVIAMTSRKIVLPHQDPADRFIAATALFGEFTLLTSDEVLLENLPGISVLDARV